MRNKKLLKALALAGAAILLVVGSVLGTLAWLTDTEVVTNTITVGKVAITLDEDDITNDDPTVRVTENSYKLIPGQVYTKDPTVTVKANSEDCYVRVMITVDKTDMWNAACAKNSKPNATFNLADFVDIQSGWTLKTTTPDNEAKTVTYEYRYDTKVLAKNVDQKLTAVFTKLTIPADWDNAELGCFTGDATIDVVAHAIQAEGFDDAAEAWAAFDTPAQQS